MGLDMYAYAAYRGQHDEYWENYNHEKGDSTVDKPREIMYWRKHPNLHGWMEQLAKRKGVEYNTFNGVELELTYDDILELEQVVLDSQLPSTSGFFFGDDADDYYKEQDLEFIRKAKAELFLGIPVFYNSSW